MAGQSSVDATRAVGRVWTGLVTFVALYSLTGLIVKPLVIALFVIVSCKLGFGTRRLTQAAVGLGFVAVVCWLGAPTPDLWPDLIRKFFSSANLQAGGASSLVMQGTAQ